MTNLIMMEVIIMGCTIAQKIIKAHLVSGEMKVGNDIGLRIDQTLTQDATGTMAYIEYEAMGIPRVKTEKSVAYIDHNTLQTGFENADDHRFIQSVCKKHGIYFSRPGNGICHQVHLERFGKPGKTLIGSDSHTPTGGGIGMLAIGAGGLDVAVAMGGGAYYITMPKMVRVNLTGKLSPWVSAKDIILAVLKVMSVKGGVGKIVEYGGEGVKTLTVPERATITNMGAELGATTSVFPSDEITREFLKAQGREEDYTELSADADAVYDEVIEINLSELEPLAACPHSPDNIQDHQRTGRQDRRSGLHRLLHQLQLSRYDARGAHPQGQEGCRQCFSRDCPRQQAGIQYARTQRRAGRHDRGWRENPRERLRSLHRHGSVAQQQGRFAENLQPQL